MQRSSPATCPNLIQNLKNFAADAGTTILLTTTLIKFNGYDVKHVTNGIIQLVNFNSINMAQSFVEDVEFDLIKGPFQGHTSEKHSIGTLSKGKYFPLVSVNGDD